MITHPDKLLFPDDGISKGEVATYYELVAPFMIPLIRARPVTMERYPSGIGAKGFMQKNVWRGFPDWLERVAVPKKGGIVNHAMVSDARSLLWMVNQNCITMHVTTSRVPTLLTPDLCVFDLDPLQEQPQVLRGVALHVRDLLGELGLTSWIKTSGSKGYHILVALDATADYDAVGHFAHRIARRLIERDPAHLTLEFSKADRGGRIFVDTGRNGFGATFAAPYTVRARAGAPVSAPCTWEEIERGEVHPRSFTLRTMPQRLTLVGDLWADMSARTTSLRRVGERLERSIPSARRVSK